MAESLPHRGATLWESSYYHCSREAQPTERFYKSVRPRSQVRRYKTIYLWWLRSTIHRKNRPCRSFEDPQEAESETGAHTSSRRETPSSSMYSVGLSSKRSDSYIKTFSAFRSKMFALYFTASILHRSAVKLCYTKNNNSLFTCSCNVCQTSKLAIK